MLLCFCCCGCCFIFLYFLEKVGLFVFSDIFVLFSIPLCACKIHIVPQFSVCGRVYACMLCVPVHSWFVANFFKYLFYFLEFIILYLSAIFWVAMQRMFMFLFSCIFYLELERYVFGLIHRFICLLQRY